MNKIAIVFSVCVVLLFVLLCLPCVVVVVVMLLFSSIIAYYYDEDDNRDHDENEDLGRGEERCTSLTQLPVQLNAVIWS